MGQQCESTGANRRASASSVTPTDLLIEVADPERVGDKEPYVVYTVRTKKADDSSLWQVKRRFQEFAELSSRLNEHTPESSLLILPPLPSKNNFGTSMMNA